MMISQASSPRGPSKINHCARGISVKPVPDHSPATLDLLVPWDIPLECRLTVPYKHKIQQSLQQLLQALQRPDAHQALVDIEHILSILDHPTTRPAHVKSTKTALKAEEVDDFDQYFGVNHVQTEDTDLDVGLCLVRGLLVNCQKFMVLCHHSPQLDPDQIALQKQGFISCVYLLERVFCLEKLTDALLS